jgi:hypothetical protein
MLLDIREMRHVVALDVPPENWTESSLRISLC